jgi:hypothetical protein
MATIPMGQGRRVAPGRAVSSGAGPVVGVGQAIQQFAGTLAQAGFDQQHREAVEQQRQAAEAKRQQAIADAAARQRDQLTLQETVGQLKTIGLDMDDGIANGTLPKEEAEKVWQERTTELTDTAVARVLPEHQEVIRRELLIQRDGLGRNVRKAVERRDQHDIRSGIDQTLEYQARQYSSDPAKATQMAMDAINSLGPFSGWAPDELAKKAQAWKEGAQFTRGYAAISSGRNDRKALDAAEKLVNDELPDLDPQRKAQLSDRAQAYRLNLDQKEEMAAQRRQREADAHLKRAEAAFNTYQTMADKGTLLDPAYTDAVMQQTRGTPYQSGIVAMAQQAKETGGLAAQPIANQRATLDAINTEIARNGRTPALDKRKDQAEKVLRGSQEDLQKDGLRAGLERGVIRELPPLNFAAGIAGVVQQVQERVPLAERVGMWAGRPVSVLTSDEAETLGQQLATLKPKERADMIAGMAGVIGPQASQGLAQQLDQKDKALALAFAYSGSQTTQGRLVSELVLRGQQAKADGTSTKGSKQPDLKASSWRAELADTLRDVYPSQKHADQVLEASELISHGIASEQGGELTKKDRERAARLAVGGAIVELNGRKVPTPFAEDNAEAMLNRRLRSVSPQEIVAQSIGETLKAAGQLAPGNIDLTKRPVSRNSDGSISTVRSIGVNIDGREVLLPTISEDGKQLSDEQAISAYRKSGKHLGKFDSPGAATAYAEALHKQQEGAYYVIAGGVRVPVDQFVESLPGQQLIYAGPGRYAVLVSGRPVKNAAGRNIEIKVN